MTRKATTELLNMVDSGVVDARTALTHRPTGEHPMTHCESVQAAREWFAANELACIADVESGATRVNNPDTYIADCMRSHDDALAGTHDHTFAMLQKAHYIRTGECPALLP